MKRTSSLEACGLGGFRIYIHTAAKQPAYRTAPFSVGTLIHDDRKDSCRGPKMISYFVTAFGNFSLSHDD